jgi:hypothetical protein
MLPTLASVFAARLQVSEGTWALIPEHGASTRVADLVFARFDVDAYVERAQISRRPLRATETVALSAMRADRFDSASVLSRKMRVTPQTAAPILRRLADDGFAEASGRGGYRRSLAVRPLFTRFVVVEAKLSEWQRAFHQARAHAAFAHEVYVALDAAYAARAQRAATVYAEAGIGLLTVAASGTVSWQLGARRRRPPLRQRMLASEAAWRRATGEMPTPLPQTRLPNAAAVNADLGVRWLPGPPPIDLPPH